ncbi:10957_t:CDS:1, partial [Acaulospora morrowiae]
MVRVEVEASPSSSFTIWLHLFSVPVCVGFCYALVICYCCYCAFDFSSNVKKWV